MDALDAIVIAAVSGIIYLTLKTHYASAPSARAAKKKQPPQDGIFKAIPLLTSTVSDLEIQIQIFLENTSNTELTRIQEQFLKAHYNPGVIPELTEKICQKRSQTEELLDIYRGVDKEVKEKVQAVKSMAIREKQLPQGC